VSWSRTAHRWLIRLIGAAIVVQFFLAGAGAFGAASFAPHEAVGWLLLVLVAIGMLLALLGRSLVRHTGVLLLLTVVQVILGVLGSDTSAWFGAVHAVNALGVMAAAGTLARASSPRGTRPMHVASTGEPRR
jgi:ABC-type transport system involved in multi-copper enzyme maturation permease subunit